MALGPMPPRMLNDTSSPVWKILYFSAASFSKAFRRDSGNCLAVSSSICRLTSASICSLVCFGLGTGHFMPSLVATSCGLTVLSTSSLTRWSMTAVSLSRSAFQAVSSSVVSS